jgi:DNA-binding PadR family transcriptional regulator
LGDEPMEESWKQDLKELEAGFERGEIILEILDKIQKVGSSLRIWILHVLMRSPKNGVEIMDTIQKHLEVIHRLDYLQKLNENGHKYNAQELQESLKNSHSRPSPGSVYPMLKKMVEDDLIRKGDNGKYSLTSKGHEIASEIFGNLRKSRVYEQNSVKNSLIEINRRITYLETVQQKDLLAYEDLIIELNRRFRKVAYSLLEE